MVLLDKKDTLFERDEKGELIPKEVTLDLKGNPKIKMIPLTRGEVKKIFSDSKEGETTKDQDKNIILSNCIEPKYTEEDLVHIKPYVANAIVTAILKNSGLSEAKEVDGVMPKN